MTTWWEEHNAMVREHGAGRPLPEAAVALLDDVEAAFAVLAAPTPGWPAPSWDQTDEAIYSRVSEPGRFAIVAARAEAWIRTLNRRGWARSRTHGTRRVLVPVRRGAVPLVLDVRHNEGATFLGIGVGDPPLEIGEHPDCACDGCDMGSDSLLQGIDETIFSVVDGSLELVEGAGERTLRTSFGAARGSASRRRVVRGVAGEPWAEGWRPRPLTGRSFQGTRGGA